MRGWGRALRAAAVLLLGSIGPARGIGAQAVADSTAVVGVYLDCQGQAGNGCDQNFFRTEILFVNWVTDRAVADVHLLVTAQQAGGGGRRYTLAFLGLNRFADDNLQLSYASASDATNDVIRRGLGEQFKIGLVRYAARTSARDRLRVTYTAPTSTAGAAQKPDPWNFWVFTFGLNGNSFGESSTSNLFLSGNFNANRTTDAWKLSIGTNFNRQRNRYTLSDRKVIAIVKNFGGNALVVKTLTPRWSVGTRITAGSQSSQNQDLSLTMGSGIE